MKFRPLSNRVLVKIREAEEKTPSGLYIPSSAQERPYEGTVVAVGPGRFTENGNFVECVIKKGDVVMLPKYAGTEIKLDGKEHFVLSEDDIIGIIE